jgi:hypothetical protein
MVLYSLQILHLPSSMSVCHSVSLFPELSVQEIVFVTQGELKLKTSSRALQKTEVKGCGEAKSTDKLLHLFTLHHFLCTKFRT